MFNYPHVGKCIGASKGLRCLTSYVGLGEKDEERNVKLNQILLLRFLRSAKPFLKEGTSLSVAGKRKAPSGNAKPSKRQKKGEDDGDSEELPSDPEDDDDASEDNRVMPLDGPGTVLITLFTCKPYCLWSLPYASQYIR